MAALTEDRNTPQSMGDNRVGPVAASAQIFAGALLMRNAAGYLVNGQTATGAHGVGRAHAAADNSAGADGDVTVRFDPGVFRYENSPPPTDQITVADIGSVAWIVDDQTVAKTNGGGTRSAAGLIEDVDALGVWVRFDEAITKIAAP
ncbi:hypothetical protein [Profundibacter sp.]